jgi:hypothetical protein
MSGWKPVWQGKEKPILEKQLRESVTAVFPLGRRGMRRAPGAAAPARLLGGNFAKVKNQHRIGRIR